MIDLEPATHSLIGLLENVREDQLADATPCTDVSLGALLDHIDGLSLAFTAAATKSKLPADQQTPSADASELGADWRNRIPKRLLDLADAWRAG